MNETFGSRSQTGEVLIYGATGYTGRLAAEHAVSRGLRPVLAGRDADGIGRLAKELTLPHRVFRLDDPTEVRRGLQGVAAVLHAAGPFSATSRPMAEGCIAAGAHYCDITGEIDVFEDLAKLDARARAAGVMLLPGAGFDVVPSDCLAAHVVARLPEAVRLRLSIAGLTRFSRGTAKTMVELIVRGTAVRSGGRIVERKRAPRGSADFGAGPRPTVGMTWGDVSTAWHSTGVADIAVFFEADRAMRVATNIPAPIKRVLGLKPVQRMLTAQIDRRLPPGPTAEQRASGSAVIVAEAWNAAGMRAASRLVTPEAYALTALTAVEIVRRASSGDAAVGFQTPSKAFGADLVLAFEGVRRQDL